MSSISLSLKGHAAKRVAVYRAVLDKIKGYCFTPLRIVNQNRLFLKTQRIILVENGHPIVNFRLKSSNFDYRIQKQLFSVDFLKNGLC